MDRRALFRAYNRCGGPRARNERLNRALGMLQARATEVRRNPNGSYFVRSPSGHLYHVWPGQACSCPDFALRGERCKHLQAVALLEAAREPARADAA